MVRSAPFTVDRAERAGGTGGALKRAAPALALVPETPTVKPFQYSLLRLCQVSVEKAPVNRMVPWGSLGDVDLRIVELVGAAHSVLDQPAGAEVPTACAVVAGCKTRC